MNSRRIVPSLWFDDQAEAAAEFYTSTIAGGRITATSRYPTSGDNPSGKPPGSVLTVEFELAGQPFTALNGGPNFTIDPSISFFVETGSAAEVDRLAAALGEGGSELMPLDTYPWSERYAWVQDRYGVSWQVMATPNPGTTVIPSLLFAGAAQGRAEAAVGFYTTVFTGGGVDAVSHYEPGTPTEGQVDHARFHILDQTLTAMDSGVPQPFTFSEAVSLQVMCTDQAEIDRLWAALTEGGEEGPCGWLKDRFGVSWQIVPENVAELMSGDDQEATDRAFRAMMPMTKLDIATLEAAYRGER